MCGDCFVTGSDLEGLLGEAGRATEAGWERG